MLGIDEFEIFPADILRNLYARECILQASGATMARISSRVLASSRTQYRQILACMAASSMFRPELATMTSNSSFSIKNHVEWVLGLFTDQNNPPSSSVAHLFKSPKFFVTIPISFLVWASSFRASAHAFSSSFSPHSFVHGGSAGLGAILGGDERILRCMDYLAIGRKEVD